MVQVRKGILETITGYSSALTTIFKAGVILFGVFAFVIQGNNTAKSNKELTEVVTELKKTVETLQENNAAEHSRIMGSLQETQDQVTEVKDNNDKWNKSFLMYVKDNTKSSEQLYKYIQGLNLEAVKTKPIVNWNEMEPVIKITKIPPIK